MTSEKHEIESPLLTVEQLAARWGVNPRTIRSQIDKGKIIAVRIGRLVKISRSHVEFIENGGIVPAKAGRHAG